MFDKKQAIFTYVLTSGTLTISETDGVTAVAMKLLSGAATYAGTKKIGTIDSTPTSLIVDKAITVTSEQTKYIDSFTIDATGGSVEIIAR
jgi:hypothetical protein